MLKLRRAVATRQAPADAPLERATEGRLRFVADSLRDAGYLARAGFGKQLDRQLLALLREVPPRSLTHEARKAFGQHRTRAAGLMNHLLTATVEFANTS
jgi:hypothetical protein